MNWVSVQSSRMKAVAWENSKMYIMFNDGSVYCYENVSNSEYLSFISSSSLGRELATFQRFHPYHRV
ncbi:putative KTSC domain-containing protein [Solobacterium phage SMO_1P]|nr:putative KTSC domain-containing protein [Solobacterium phage SMO_1P]